MAQAAVSHAENVMELNLGASGRVLNQSYAEVLIQNMFQFVALLDTRGVLICVNEPALAAADITDSRDLLGVPLWECRWFADPSLDPTTSTRTRDGILNASATGTLWRTEVINWTKFGPITVDFTLKPVFSQASDSGKREVIYLVAEGRDITEKKLMNEALDAKNKEMTHLYAQLSEADKRRSQFFANLSHEFRTPLTLIAGPTEKLLARTDLDPTMRRSLQVNDLLDLSKLDAGKLAAHYQRVDLRKLMEYTMDHFSSLSANKGIRLETTTQESLREMEVDPEKLLRILLNLLSNAVKFTPTDGVIHLRASVDEAGRNVRISVGDSGPGVPKHFRANLFQRFQQAQTGDTRAHTGTGLGLSIVRDFAELHGGSVMCSEEPAPEGGALFVVTLPLLAPPGTDLEEADSTFNFFTSAAVESAAKNAVADVATRRYEAAEAQNSTANVDSASQEVERPATPTVGGSAGTLPLVAGVPASGAEPYKPLVLVVEDNADLREFIATSLEPRLRVATATDGLDGFYKAIKLQPDVILSDVQMPVLSGDQMVLKLRSTAQTQHIPVVLLTARADEALRLRMLESGVQEFLSKPFSVAELRVRLENMAIMKLARTRLQAELQSTTHNVAELTQQLSEKNTKLQLALLEAERVQRMKDDFLLTLSHELRTPLNGIVGFTDMIKTMCVNSPSLASADVLPCLEVVEQCAWSQSRMVDDLLDTSRLITGRLSLELGELVLNDLIQASVDAVKQFTAEKSHRMVVSLPSERVRVYGDAARLRQVLWNLLHNAAKFTPKQGRITVCLDLSDGHKMAIVEVSDTGIGLSEEQIPRLFRRFGQLDTTTTRKYGGLGIGLALVKGLVELHGGEVSASSPGLGKGTTITLRLPTHSAAALPVPVSSSLEKLDVNTDLVGRRIFVVDDDSTALVVMTRILSRAGAEVRSYLLPRELLSAIKSEPNWADIVLSDVSMPEIDGFGVLSTVENTVPRLRGKVIAATAHASEVDLKRITASGFVACLTKPLRAPAVVSTITQVLARSVSPRHT